MKVLITPRSFAKYDQKPYQMLLEKGYEVIRNTYDNPFTPQEIREKITYVDGVIVGTDPIDRSLLEKAKNLKAIAKYGAGMDNIDVDFAKAKGIKVSRTQGANSQAVADYAMGLMLTVARKIHITDRECRKGKWEKIITGGIYGKTLGIIGTGNIGKAVAKRAKGFDMKILAFSNSFDEEFAKKYDVEYVALEDLYKNSDIITLHVPLTPETQYMIGEKQLSMMKKTVILINTARGGLIDEKALCKALKEKIIWGAGLDVFDEEPPANPIFYEMDNVVISPHCAASTYDAADQMSIMAAKNLIRDLSDC